MKLKEIFDQLTVGELSQLSIAGGTSGMIRPEDYDKMLSHVNLALTALYKRFNLKEGRLVVDLKPAISTYSITPAYAASNVRSKQPVKYLLDVASPFKDDLLKIERVYTEGGYELALNNVDDPFSINTPSFNMIRVPTEILANGNDLDPRYKTTKLEVVYRANHPKLVSDDGDLEPESVEVELPESHLEPLLLFIASRAHTPTGMTGEFNSGNNYAQKYELACQELERFNLRVDGNSQPDRLGRNGWV